MAGWGQIRQYASRGFHDYDALYVRLDKRLSNRHQYGISYTLAKETNTGGTGEWRSFLDPNQEVGPGDQDRRHTLVVSGAVLLPFDITLGGVWNYRTSRPFSALAGRDLDANGRNQDYVPGTSRAVFNRGNNEANLALVNAWRASQRLGPISLSQLVTDEYQTLDARISKAFVLASGQRIELVAQVFNLFGTNNLGGSGTSNYQQNSRSSAFGTISSVRPRQQGELAVRIRF